MICKFCSANNTITLHSIINRSCYNQNSNDINNTNNHNIDEVKFKKFQAGILKNISDIKLLLSKENNIEKTKYSSIKDYFNYQDIESEMENIKNISLFKRKQIVNKKLNEIDALKDIKEAYFDLLKIIIKDNTNKNLITKYLQFLGKNKKQLDSNFRYYEKYENELKYYLIIFDTDEALKTLNIIKKVTKKN